MTAEDLERFLSDYERAWRTAGTEVLEDLFTPEATYRPHPFEPAIRGRDALAAFWEREREGPGETFTLRTEPVAIDAPVAVVRAEVDYAGPPPRRYRDLWVITLAPDGRASAFEEWPFWPGQPRVAEGR